MTIKTDGMCQRKSQGISRQSLPPITGTPPTRLDAAGWRINTFDVNWRGKTDQAAEVAAIRTPSQEMREHGVGAVTQSSVLLGEGGGSFIHRFNLGVLRNYHKTQPLDHKRPKTLFKDSWTDCVYRF